MGQRDTQSPAGADPAQLATKAGLRYVSDDEPGIRRVSTKTGFRYLMPDGSAVRKEPILQRIKSLAIPPAWENVWICIADDGHLQATGRDARQRKQYRYHPQWRQMRDETKYERMVSFGQILPSIRQRVEQDMALPGLQRDKVLATIVHLLQTTMIRVGNEEYARTNGSYGLTTLHDRHVQISGGSLQFRFRGKSGVRHAIKVNDRRLANIVRRMRDLPGQTLFQYIDDDGELRSVGSADVNDYLHQITNDHFTAKDFRTWAGTMLAALALRDCETFRSETEARKNISSAIEAVAEKLGNTPSICRKCYVHPVVIESYLDHSIMTLKQLPTPKECAGKEHELTPEEASIIALLQQRMADTTSKDAADIVSAKERKTKQRQTARRN